MLAGQGARCANPACLKPLTITTLQIDHDHDWGPVRGLLCNSCNIRIGGLGDNLSGVLGAVAYLARYEIGGTVDDWMPKIDAMLRSHVAALEAA